MVKVDQAEADPTRAAEIASFMVVLLMLLGSDVMVKISSDISQSALGRARVNGGYVDK